MNLHEYQAKEILARYGVPVPPGKVAYTPEEAKRIAEELGKRVVVKAQVHVGGRGKAGGVKLANTPQEAYEKAQAILGMNIKGLTVRKVLVAEAVDIAKEYYAGLILDRSQKRAVLMLSKEGGVDIEEVAARNPEAIHKFWIDPHKGFRAFEAREMVKRAGLEGSLNKLAQVLVALYRAYEGVDASIAEINPLVVTTEGQIVAADARSSWTTTPSSAIPIWRSSAKRRPSIPWRWRPALRLRLREAPREYRHHWKRSRSCHVHPGPGEPGGGQARQLPGHRGRGQGGRGV